MAERRNRAPAPAAPARAGNEVVGGSKLMGLDIATIAHVGVELVVVGGLVFWFNRRISAVEEKCRLLEEKVTQLEAAIMKQHGFLVEHERILQQFQPRQQPETKHKSKPKVVHNKNTATKPLKKPHVRPQARQTTKIDDILQAEISEIESERETNGDGEVLEINTADCTDGVCLVNKPRRSTQADATD
jgi:hypothetical protein